MSAPWAAALIPAAIAVLGFLGWLARRLWKLVAGTTRFLDDYFGEPEHNGVPVRPGVMARLADLEKLVGEVRAETQPNGGTSLRDVVHRIASDVGDVKHEQARLKTEIELRLRPDEGKKPS